MYEPNSAGQGPPSRRFEISAVILTALGALALVSLLSDAAGIIGTWLSVLLRYLFGQLAIVPPIMLIVHALLSLRYGAHVQYTRRALAAVSLYFVALVVIHMVAGQPLTLATVGSYSAVHPGGGVLGGIISTLLIRAVGRSGSWVVIAAWTAISAILISDTPLSRYLAKISAVLARLVKGLALGWTDFWRGVRAEFEELVALIKDRRALRRDRAALREAKSTLPAEEPSGKGRRGRRRTRRKDKPESGESLELSAPVAAAVTEDAEAEDVEAAPAYVAVEEAEDYGALDLDEASADTDLASEPEVGRSRRAARTVHSGDEVLDVAEGSAAADAPIYRLPPLALLERPKAQRRGGREEPDQSEQLEETLDRFGIEAKVVNVSRGPAVTRYELQPAPGVKVKQITSLADDLALALAAAGIRIEAPVPGKSVVGIEVPNKETSPVFLREVLEDDTFSRGDSKLLIGLGKDITGNAVVADLRKLLHVLIAGATGSGKSVCINSIVVSLLYKALPNEVKLLMIDPKRVELAVYDGIPHLVTPVVTDPKQAAAALRWAVKEMENRYTRFSQVGVRNIDGYNRWVASQVAEAGGEEEPDLQPLPYIVIIIDELADLMMVAQHDVEDSISRLAQMARAAGLHLIIATQRPSVDVITGLIKANVPSRISFAVSSSHDSRTILDMVGAERLLGKGDMLYYPTGSNKPSRAQGAFVSDKEVQDVVSFWKAQGEPVYDEEVVTVEERSEDLDEVDDELYEDAVRLVMDTDSASISMLQRRFRIGYSRAARLIDMMELRGIVGPYQGSKPREVLRRTVDTE